MEILACVAGVQRGERGENEKREARSERGMGTPARSLLFPSLPLPFPFPPIALRASRFPLSLPFERLPRRLGKYGNRSYLKRLEQGTTNVRKSFPFLFSIFFVIAAWSSRLNRMLGVVAIFFLFSTCERKFIRYAGEKVPVTASPAPRIKKLLNFSRAI